jgi:tRNA pseudouridine55 synthase
MMMLNGFLNLAKPYGMSSAQAVGAVKRILRPKKIGHAGTLDPLAEGVLPLALGEATKAVSLLVDAKKTYRFTIQFGTQTATDDAEGAVIATSDMRPDRAAIEAVLPQFIGEIQQLPPAYSALKVNGKRAYALARAGEEVVLAPRPVWIERLELVSEMPGESVELCVRCGKGTYVRSLARDISEKLGTCGHVTRLIREGVGTFTLEAAISLDFLAETGHNPAASGQIRPAWLLPIASVLDDIPACEVDATAVRQLRFGLRVEAANSPMREGKVAALHGGELIALCDAMDGGLKPIRVFNH